MAQAKQGDTVKVHYTGRLDDGTVFDTSVNREPLQFTISEGRIMPSFEQAVVGMNPGESKTTRIPAEKAYGPYRKEGVIEVDQSQFPEDLEPAVGQQLQLTQQDGQSFTVRVVEVSESGVKLDANHPLAGKDLTFEIQLLEIE